MKTVDEVGASEQKHREPPIVSSSDMNVLNPSDEIDADESELSIVKYVDDVHDENFYAENVKSQSPSQVVNDENVDMSHMSGPNPEWFGQKTHISRRHPMDDDPESQQVDSTVSTIEMSLERHVSIGKPITNIDMKDADMHDKRSLVAEITSTNGLDVIAQNERPPPKKATQRKFSPKFPKPPMFIQFTPNRIFNAIETHDCLKFSSQKDALNELNYKIL